MNRAWFLFLPLLGVVLLLLHDPEPSVEVRTVSTTSTSSSTTTTTLTTATSAPPTTTTVLAVATPVARARTAPQPSTGRCGGDLPPCWVMQRESGGDIRIWNGRCYMPFGSLGKCGISDASGKWQFLRSTWARFAGFVNAADAPEDVQDAKARLTWNGGRGCRHWMACS